MEIAGIEGDHASPKGLRHGFAVQAIQANVPLTLVQRWLGHADIKTTAIYTSAMGAEERSLASRMWREEKKAPPAAKTEQPAAPATISAPAEPATPPMRRDAHSAGVRYRLRYRSTASIGGHANREPSQVSKKQALSIESVPKKTLLDHLRDCALVQFWLNCTSKKYVNSST